MNTRVYEKGKSIRLGVIGTGRITGRFMPELEAVKTAPKVVAVYNVRRSGAERFAKQWQVPKVCDSIEELFDSVDAVYIASPHSTHVEYAKAAILAGKHVLCEKPLAFSKAEAEELFSLAKSKSVCLMEAIKTAYCPGFIGALELLKNDCIGEIVDVESCFTKLTDSHLREFWDGVYSGSFIELGTYTMLPIMKILGMAPKSVRYWSRDTVLGNDAYAKISWDYGVATGTSKTGLGAKSEGQLIVTGTKGYMVVPAPWWLTNRVEIHYEDPTKIDVYEYPYEGTGLRYEIDAFVTAVLDGKTDFTKLSPEESIWLAGQMENYLAARDKPVVDCEDEKIGIWAHRGCSAVYPENTLEAFRAAAELEGITGVELDVQLTQDGEPVVFHDEQLERITDGVGLVKEYTLGELKKLRIIAHDEKVAEIVTLREVFDLLAPYCKNRGLMINIELKTSVYRYPGIEEKVVALVNEYGLKNSIIYSSFLPESMGRVKELCPTAQTAILAKSIEKCLADAKIHGADGLHPWVGGVDLLHEEPYHGYPIRVWGGVEPSYTRGGILKETNLKRFAKVGVTDIITNMPEIYLAK